MASRPGSGEITIPLSVIAALSFLSPPDDERDQTGATLRAATKSVNCERATE
jgi:hypothetical protein